MQFADIKNDIAFRKIFGNEQKTAPLISFLNASLEELKAYDNVTIKVQDERGEREIIVQKAMEKGEEKGREEMILEMDKEGFSIQQIAKVSKKSEQEVTQIIDNHTNK